MKAAPLRNNMFLYDLTIRILAFWATILFSLLFFTGARADNKTQTTGDVAKKTVTYTYESKSGR